MSDPFAPSADPDIPTPTREDLLPHVHGSVRDQLAAGTLDTKHAQNEWIGARRKWDEGHKRDAARRREEQQARQPQEIGIPLARGKTEDPPDVEFSGTSRDIKPINDTTTSTRVPGQTAAPTEKEERDAKLLAFMDKQVRASYDAADFEQKQIIWAANERAFNEAEIRKEQRRQREQERMEEILDTLQRIKEDPTKAHLLPLPDADLHKWYEGISKVKPTVPHPGGIDVGIKDASQEPPKRKGMEVSDLERLVEEHHAKRDPDEAREGPLNRVLDSMPPRESTAEMVDRMAKKIIDEGKPRFQNLHREIPIHRPDYGNLSESELRQDRLRRAWQTGSQPDPEDIAEEEAEAERFQRDLAAAREKKRKELESEFTKPDLGPLQAEADRAKKAMGQAAEILRSKSVPGPEPANNAPSSLRAAIALSISTFIWGLALNVLNQKYGTSIPDWTILLGAYVAAGFWLYWAYHLNAARRKRHLIYTYPRMSLLIMMLSGAVVGSGAMFLLWKVIRHEQQSILAAPPPASTPLPVSEEVAKILKSAERRAALRFKGIVVDGDLNNREITLGVVMSNEGERQVLPYPAVELSVAYTVEPLAPYFEDDFYSEKRTVWHFQRRTYGNAIDPKGQETIEYKINTVGYDEIAKKGVVLKNGGYLYVMTKSKFRDEYGELTSESCWVYAPSQGFKGQKCPSHNY